MKKVIGIALLVLLIINNVSAQDLIGHIGKRGQITLNYQPPSGGTGFVFSATFNWFYYDGSNQNTSNSSLQFVLKSVNVEDYAYVDGKRYSKEDVSLVNNQYPKNYSWEAHLSRGDFGIKTSYGKSMLHGKFNNSYPFIYKSDFDGFSFTVSPAPNNKSISFSGLGNPELIVHGNSSYELKNVLRLKQKSAQKTTNSTTSSNQQTTNKVKSNTSVSNPDTTNYSSLKENNTAQEKSVASNINLKKAKSIEYSNKGNQFYNNGNYDEAEMYWQKAIVVDPSNQAAKNNLDNLKSIQNSNTQIMAQSQERTNNFNAQQQNIQQSSENIANNLVDGSPNAVGQAGVATAKLLAESGAGYAESMLGGAGVVALGALLNGGGKTKSLGLTGENITKEYKNATYVGGFYDGKFDGNMKVTFKNGIQLERTSVRKPGVSDYETIIIVPNTCKGKVHCLFKNNRVKMNTPKNYLQTLLIPLRNYKSELKYFNGDKYVGRFYHSNSHLFVGGEYSFANGKIVQINSSWADLAFKSAKVTFKNGNTIEGKFIEMIREGKSTYTWTDNDKYECKFDEGKRIGKLDLTFNNGDVFHTNYKDNTFSKGTYKQSNGEILSISIDRIIEEELNEIPQSNLFKILLIAYEDMLNTENNKKANKLYVKLLKYHDNDSKLIENELKSLLVERNPFLFISPSIENNIACLYYHLDKGYANLKYNDSISALKHYYCASKIIKCIGSDIFDSPRLRQLLYQVEIDCDSNYYSMALSADKVFQNTELFNLISSFDYKLFTKPIAKSNCKLAQFQTPFYWYWDKTGNVTYQEYSCYLNETVTKKDKIKRPHFTYYKGMILPQYNYASKIADLRYKDYVEYMEWLTNKTPTRQEYRKHYPS